MARLRYNGLTATLGADLTSSDTTITFAAALTSAAGAVPTITGGDTIALSILDGTGAVSEIVSLTAYTTGATTGTIARAQESTSAAAHASGDSVIHGATVADFSASGSAPIVYSDTLPSLFTTSTTGAWVTITGLSFSFTPSAAGVLLLNSRVRLNHGAANVYSRATCTPAPVSGSSNISYSFEGAPGGRHTLPFFGTYQVAAGTTYTIAVDVFVNGGGAWSVDETPEDTTLSGTYFRS